MQYEISVNTVITCARHAFCRFLIGPGRHATLLRTFSGEKKEFFFLAAINNRHGGKMAGLSHADSHGSSGFRPPAHRKRTPGPDGSVTERKSLPRGRCTPRVAQVTNIPRGRAPKVRLAPVGRSVNHRS